MVKKRRFKISAVRGGFSLRKKESGIRAALKELYECSQCKAQRVKRVSAGIWRCKKCGYTFAGGAYRPSTELGKLAARSLGGGVG